LPEDISKEKVSQWGRRVKGGKFLWIEPGWIDELGAIRDIITRHWRAPGREADGLPISVFVITRSPKHSNPFFRGQLDIPRANTWIYRHPGSISRGIILNRCRQLDDIQLISLE
jgi:hypothetical protein